MINKFCYNKVPNFQYWHDPLLHEEYVEKSQFIAEINNEGEMKDASYAENLAKLENFVMVMFNQVID
jgi:palmitoyl-protein thioesterase